MCYLIYTSVLDFEMFAVVTTPPVLHNLFAYLYHLGIPPLWILFRNVYSIISSIGVSQHKQYLKMTVIGCNDRSPHFLDVIVSTGSTYV
jgi:hypothetical protein